MDYSDLYSVMAFFRGTPKGKGGHDEVARRIASNGQCWVERSEFRSPLPSPVPSLPLTLCVAWRREDLQTYMFRLYLEYARLMSADRDSGKMDFILPARSTPGKGLGENKPLPVLENAAEAVAQAEALPIA